MISIPLRSAHHVLLIDDDLPLREALRETLVQEGYRVSDVDNGAEGLDALRGGDSPDLIVLDLHMPVMNGWEFRVQQRNHPAWAQIPVVVLTSEQGAHARAMDAAAMLHKPVSATQFLQTVRNILSAVERERIARAEKMASLGMLAAGVAHEINNPLAFVLSNLHFALEELDQLDPAQAPEVVARLTEVRQALDEANQGAERVRTLVADLRRFARTEAEGKRLVDVRDVVKLAVRMANHEIRLRAELELELGEVPQVNGDDAKLGQVFLNLLVNAAQAFPEARPSQNRIRVTTFTDDRGDAAIEIRDNGCGIPPAALQRIFDPFFTTKPVGIGTGLGLTICREVVSHHGGQLSVQSEVGKGTTFRVQLPAASAAAQG